MKCIMRAVNREVVRVSNEDAEKLVKSGRWEYVPKELWKKCGRLYA